MSYGSDYKLKICLVWNLCRDGNGTTYMWRLQDIVNVYTRCNKRQMFLLPYSESCTRYRCCIFCLVLKNYNFELFDSTLQTMFCLHEMVRHFNHILHRRSWECLPSFLTIRILLLVHWYCGWKSLDCYDIVIWKYIICRI